MSPDLSAARLEPAGLADLPNNFFFPVGHKWGGIGMVSQP
jgi:hypothetical protein